MKHPLSICLVTGEYPPAVGGVGDYVAKLASGLAALGHAVTVVTSPQAAPRSSNSLGTAAVEDGMRVVSGVRSWGLGAAADIANVAREARADVVHLQYQTAAYGLSPVVNALPALARARGLRARFVTTLHDLRGPYLFPKAGRLRHLAVHVLIGMSHGTIFTDPSDLLAAHPVRQAAWIPIGPNLFPTLPMTPPEARARLGLRAEEAVVAHFGFLNATKGVDVLLRAAERLVRAGLDVRLLFVGDPLGASDPTNASTARRLNALTTSLGLEERIIRTGFLPAQEASAALLAADIAALPFADGASLRRGSLLACFAHRLPVVTTMPQPSPVLPERCRVEPFATPERYAITEDAVAFVRPGDDAGLARELYRLLEDPPRRARLADGGYQLATRLDWSAISRATSTFYQRLLAATDPSLGETSGGG